MRIWETLGIEPTTDKRKIKKAYAAKSREIHPEEKPEEFQVLYEAYQAALQYTEEDSAGRPDFPKERASDHTVPVHGQKAEEDRPEPADRTEETEEEGKLRSYFEKQSEQWEEKLALFYSRWKEVKFEYRNPEVQKWWADYLSSKDFQDIQYHPELLRILGEEMDQKLHYDDVIRLLFWEAYGFHDSAEDGYQCQGDLLKLRSGLYPAWERKRQEEIRRQQEEQRRRTEEKQMRIRRRIGLVLAAVLVVAGSVFLYGKLTRGRRYVEAYMERRYPQTEFSRPRRGRDNGYNICYEFYSLSHPDILITFTFNYSVTGEPFGEREDYGLQLLEHYAGQYELACGRLEEGFDYAWPYEMGEEISLLYYPDLETLDEFCEKTVCMFREQEELQQLAAVGICKEDALYPDILVNGGTKDLRVTEEQFYRPWEMEASGLEASVRESLMQYMSHFEQPDPEPDPPAFLEDQEKIQQLLEQYEKLESRRSAGAAEE